jgi:hypothetical protein
MNNHYDEIPVEIQPDIMQQNYIPGYEGDEFG